MNLSLYSRVNELHGALPWGSVLDAGSWPGSMRWRLSLPTERLCTSALERLRDRPVAVALQTHVAALRNRALAFVSREGGLRHGHDYIIVAEPM